MKVRRSTRPNISSKSTVHANARALFAQFQQSTYPEIRKIEGCRLEINFQKRTISIVEGTRVIMRIVHVPLNQIRKEFMELKCQG